MTTLGDQLATVLTERGWTNDLAVGGVIGRWAEIVGQQVADHAAPVGFEGTVLTVQASSTAWATQLRMMESSLLGRIEAVVGTGVVTEIHILSPAAPPRVKGRLRVPGRGPRDTWG